MTTATVSPTVQRDIPYSSTLGDRAVGDLFLPSREPSGSPVLLIHGGGWKGLSKEGFEFMAPFFLNAGRPVFNINYRLLGAAPWPACGEDCVAAGQFVLAGGLGDYGLPAAEKLLVCGASAGGHLAMMTGLQLPRQNVEGILSMAGPSRVDWVATNRDPLGLCDDFIPQFFGRALALDDPVVRAASPALRVMPDPPPLFCYHSRNDLLVPLGHSLEAKAAWEAADGLADVTVIDGFGDLHGFWTDNDRQPGTLRPDVGTFVERSLTLLS